MGEMLYKPMPRRLFQKLNLHGTQIKQTALKGPEVPFKVLGVWAKDSPLGIAINIPPVVIEIKPGVTPIKMRQYPIPMRTPKEISHHLQGL
jgi:hypothetical protein